MQNHYRFGGFMGRRVHLGISGSIAAYKALDLCRTLQESDCTVSATLSDSACRFVTPLSFEALGASPVYTGMFDAGPDTSFAHLEPGQSADALALVPASADIIGKIANGIADTMLSCQAMAFPGPRLIAPAMNPAMWASPAVQRNWETLKKDGWVCIEPESGHVACGDIGKGRLADLDTIHLSILKLVTEQDLAGQKVLVTLGPTREQWDAVRFWSNPSTGSMGAALAVAAWLRGADVTVVCGPVDCKFPPDINVIPVTSAREMHAACLDVWPRMTVGVCTAAVADFRPTPHGSDKFKKAGAETLTVEFASNPDILRSLGDDKGDRKLIGFAAETGDPRDEALRKLTTKHLDVIAANRIDKEGSGFGVRTNEMFVATADGRRETWPLLPKTEVAWRLWDILQIG
ncbi:bifunctional phosphopantothenoylcysteine decarboxylase/phosphopantothenate--cysteine ligase CoaBC [Salidesulfovibrio brasiliensis]|uniref:bifunctional phosphopantothenoylcysteine decarboxylase/phosphopantothenate--cysteine ligase CoaBC n=1 Tax=Salidesulfovibrio brasiliensis TaxID=221711 RepID=UPI0006D2079E|nr:bifunctional phosphopantothenoylcysteine decarboxylase/phosphopantothenate--cysteine ligase CoaBC [Salidesulfovibrio brasiliensis]